MKGRGMRSPMIIITKECKSLVAVCVEAHLFRKKADKPRRSNKASYTQILGRA